ncbi:hypothetical protein [Streptomyces sp. NPDC002564]|uniref:hypothetical protein n=1 Tax=Streptomyces sp. NPDC002564 TaxID=3364649 RepID=UPI0036AB4764
MGIESDQLVYDYLSRVGDLAQQRQLPSGDRMRLVSELRNRIDRGRTAGVGDSPAAVRRILARLGTPEEVVDDAAGGTTGAAGTTGTPGTTADPAGPGAPRTAVPGQRGSRTRPRREPDEADGPGSPGGPGRSRAPRAPRAPREPARRPRAEAGEEAAPRGLRRIVPRPRRAAPRTPEPPGPGGPDDFEGFTGPVPSPPHLAGADELGPSGAQPDWWRVDSSPFGLADSVPGFVGGVEIPEILKPPPTEDGSADEEDEEDGADGTEGADEEATEHVRRRRWRIPRPGGRGVRADTGPTFGNPLLLLAAALLVVGAALGNLVALGVGWLIAYMSRRLTRAEAKVAVLVLPGLAAAAGITWLWGRGEGRWGDPIRDGHLSDAMADTWPWVVRGAAVASALFLLWRSQRYRP